MISILAASPGTKVRYLYAYPGGSLFQPVYLGVRDDLSISACALSQLKFKSSEEN
jgi:bifunctional non-homologous end joining protein LigD